MIVLLCLGHMVADVRSIKKRRKDEEEKSNKAITFSGKPVNQWSEEEVTQWLKLGSMHQETYVTEATRSSIAEKLEASRVDGEFLCQYGTDIEKLVQLLGLTCGDSMKLAEEVLFLTKNGSSEDIQVIEMSVFKDEKKTDSEGSEDMLRVDSAVNLSKD